MQYIRVCEDNMDFKVLADLIENGLPFQKMLGIRYAEATVRLLGNRVGNAQVVLWSEGSQEEHVAEGRGVYNIRRSN